MGFAGREGLVRGAGLALLAATACGPSFQAVYECDVRFEHCYALDQGGTSTDAMKECWRDWLHGYTYGQSRDRVEYAATRFSELSLDPTLPSVEAPRAHRPHDMVAPLPTSAFAPPPNLAASTQPPGPVGVVPPPQVVPVSAPVSQAPGQQCTNACAGRWTDCHKGCSDGACQACDRSYRTCVPACFQDARQAPRSLR